MIRAGYLIDNQGYQSGTPDTYMSGWGYEYLQDISYHTEGWKYEYVLGTFSDIMAELDAAMTQILTSNPRYNDEIKTRYSVINVGSSSLTDRERDWLASCDNTVTVGYLDNLRPYSLRGKDNQMEGALSAVVSDMRERFGITVNERAYSSNSDSEAALGRGEIDVALPFAKDYWIADQEGYAQSDSLASSS